MILQLKNDRFDPFNTVFVECEIRAMFRDSGNISSNVELPEKNIAKSRNTCGKDLIPLVMNIMQFMISTSVDGLLIKVAS